MVGGATSASRPLKTRGSRNHGFSEVEMPLPRSTGAEFLETGSRNPPPQGAKRPGGAAEGGARGIFETVSKKSAPGEGDFQKYFKKSAPGEGHLFLKLHPGHFFEMALGGVIYGATQSPKSFSQK